jgi:K+-sensing histidine kinase KdpD
MKLNLSKQILSQCASAVLAIMITVFVMLIIGRNVLGETVIALLYLLPIGWVTAKWGQLPGACAAITAALTFDYFFIPPYLTFTIGSIEGWIVLAIFVFVAVVLIGRIQFAMTQAQIRERETMFMYELSERLAGAESPEAVAKALAMKLQELYMASLVRVTIWRESQPGLVVAVPENAVVNGKSIRIIPIQATHDLLGEIRIWEGYRQIPPEENRLLNNFAHQAAFTVERLDRSHRSA